MRAWRLTREKTFYQIMWARSFLTQLAYSLLYCYSKNKHFMAIVTLSSKYVDICQQLSLDSFLILRVSFQIRRFSKIIQKDIHVMTKFLMQKPSACQRPNIFMCLMTEKKPVLTYNTYLTIRCDDFWQKTTLTNLTKLRRKTHLCASYFISSTEPMDHRRIVSTNFAVSQFT